MGILDDAIKEHLELKRQHGAAESELKQLEDEAFGAAERPGAETASPDPFAEAPTQFMAQPGQEGEKTAAPEAQAEAAGPDAEEAAGGRPAPRSEIADLQEPPPAAPEPSAPAPAPEARAEEAPAEEPSAEEEPPAMEHEAIAEPVPEPSPQAAAPTGPTTEEREAIAEQPTEMFDLEEELASSQAEAPSEEELVEEGIEEPRLAPVDPLAAAEEVEEQEGEYEEDEDFWDEKRLSDELDQALEAPAEIEDEEARFEDAATEAELEADEPEQRDSSGEEEDVLEETPDFLEETDDDQLWFEQKPPKDFDFDD